jgi:dienelactone hydrolase
MKEALFSGLLAVLCAAGGRAQQPAPARLLAPPAREIPLYSGVAPGSEKWNWTETTSGNGLIANNVVKPVLQYYPADKSKAVGTAMVVAPGGGFRSLMMSYEGVDIAQRLNAVGIDAFVLKYRLRYSGTAQENGQAGQDLIEIGGADGRQAIRMVRERAAEFGYRPNRVGIIGYSAGGSVTLATVYGAAETRPDFAVPIYPYIAAVTAPPTGAPPLFIAVAADDTTVDIRIPWICSWPGAKPGCPPNCTYSRPGFTASRKRADLPTVTWTGWKSGCASMAGSRARRISILSWKLKTWERLRNDIPNQSVRTNSRFLGGLAVENG